MTQASAPPLFKSRLHEMTQTTPTCLWNYSASIEELTSSITHGAVGATCNPVIVVGILKKEMALWRARIVHEFDRSTTQRLGNKTKPLASLGRETTLTVMPRVVCAQVLNSSPA